MQKEILVIIPSRSAGTGREINVQRFIQHWMLFTEGHSDICICLDSDDEHYYSRYEGVKYTINENERLVPKLNRAAAKFKDQYKAIAFFGDDHIIKSKWEIEFLDYFEKNNGVGIAYGNDLLQYERIPTAVCLTTNIITELGYMIPTDLLHMYADNFWLDLGKHADCIKYFPNIIFEHLHPDNGKSNRDSQYVYAAATVRHDAAAYDKYINSKNFIIDINKIKRLQNKE
jgi:hypothetical protein